MILIRNNNILGLLALGICSLTAMGQDSTLTSNLPSVSLSLHYASIFAHSKSVQNTTGANPIGIEFLFAKQRRDELTWNQCHCFPNTGLGLNYFNFDSKILGQGVSVFFLLEPQFRITRRLKFIISAYSGFSWLSMPYHTTTNPTNMSYSLPINAYVGLGLGLQYLLHTRWQIGLVGNFLHNSNGGIKNPNKGINWPSLNLRLAYSISANALPNHTKKSVISSRYHRIDFGSFLSSKTLAVGEKQRFLIWGINTLYSRQVSSLNAVTVGTEMIIDYALREKLKRAQADARFLRAGISIGHEFLLGKFVFSQQFGYYLFTESLYYNQFYHKWGLNYYTDWGIYFGTQLLAHKQIADFLDFRIGYSLKLKKNKRNTLAQ